MKMTRASYTNNWAVTYEPSREKNCLRCSRPGPTQTKQYSNSIWLHACNLFCLCHKQFEVYKISLLMGPPQGFWGSGEKGYLFSGSWGALLIILGELGSKHILLGI